MAAPDVVNWSSGLNALQKRIYYDILKCIKDEESLDYYDEGVDSVTTSDEEFDEENYTKLQERQHLNKDYTIMDDQSNTTKNIDSIVIDDEDEHEDNIDQGREYDLHTEEILHADTYRDERKHVTMPEIQAIVVIDDEDLAESGIELEMADDEPSCATNSDKSLDHTTEFGESDVFNSREVYKRQFLACVKKTSDSSQVLTINRHGQLKFQVEQHGNTPVKINDDTNLDKETHGQSSVSLTEKDKFTCQRCTKSFQSRVKLLQHLFKHKQVIQIRNGVCYKCGVCEKNFIKPQSFGLHLNSHTGQDSVVCRYCGSSYYSRYSLKSHLKQQHGSTVNWYKCPLLACHKALSSAYRRSAHMSLHNKFLNNCTICSKQFSLKCSLAFRKKIHHNNAKEHACTPLDSNKDNEVNSNDIIILRLLTIPKHKIPSHRKMTM